MSISTRNRTVVNGGVILVLILLASHVAKGALVAYYTFDDLSDRYKDSSGNSYDGAAAGSGTTFVASGISGLGDAMNSTTSGRFEVSVSIPVSLSLFSISFWATSGTEWDNWISMSSSGFDTLVLQNAPYSPPTAFLDNPGGISGYSSWDVSAGLSTDLQHIVLTGDASAETVSLYRNGSLVSYNTWAVSSSVLLGDLTIGGSRNVTARDISAIIDDVQVYDTALSGTDVSYLYLNPGTAIPEPSMFWMLATLGMTTAFLRRRGKKSTYRSAKGDSISRIRDPAGTRRMPGVSE